MVFAEISEFFNRVVTWASSNLILVAVIIGAVVIVLYFLFKPKKEEKYKQLVLAKEIKKDLKSLFNMTEQSVGYGKDLYIGSRFIGFVLNSVFINFYYKNNPKKQKPMLDVTAKAETMKKKFPEATDIVEANIKKEGLDYKVCLGFKVCGKSRFSRLLALFGFGIKYYIVDQEILDESTLAFNINPYSQPTRFLDVFIFSNVARKVVEEIAFKITREQELNSMVNFLPKLTFHELQQAKNKSTMDLFEDMNKKRRKEQLEQIKRA
jgi:hypothetical protein